MMLDIYAISQKKSMRVITIIGEHLGGNSKKCRSNALPPEVGLKSESCSIKTWYTQLYELLSGAHSIYIFSSLSFYRQEH